MRKHFCGKVSGYQLVDNIARSITSNLAAAVGGQWGYARGSALGALYGGPVGGVVGGVVIGLSTSYVAQKVAEKIYSQLRDLFLYHGYQESLYKALQFKNIRRFVNNEEAECQYQILAQAFHPDIGVNLGKFSAF